MANAYATIANGGVHHDWFIVKKVTRASDDKVLYRAPRKTDRALPDDIAATSATPCSRSSRPAPAQNAQALGRPAAGKTGTATNDDGDVSSSWFVGYTPQVATAVMYVRGKGNEALNGYLPSYFGANYPTYTWRALMDAVLEGTDIEDFPPAGQRRRGGARRRARAVHPAADSRPRSPSRPEAPSRRRPTPRPPPTQAPAPPSRPGTPAANGGRPRPGGGTVIPTDPTCTTRDVEAATGCAPRTSSRRPATTRSRAR